MMEDMRAGEVVLEVDLGMVIEDLGMIMLVGMTETWVVGLAMVMIDLVAGTWAVVDTKIGIQAVAVMVMVIMLTAIREKA